MKYYRQYALASVIRYYGRLPKTTEVSGGHVFGTLGSDRADPTRWQEPPYERLANIPTYDLRTIPHTRTTQPVAGLADPMAVEAFIKRHGILWARVIELTDNFSGELLVIAGNAESSLNSVSIDHAFAVDAQTFSMLSGDPRTSHHLTPTRLAPDSMPLRRH